MGEPALQTGTWIVFQFTSDRDCRAPAASALLRTATYSSRTSQQGTDVAKRISSSKSRSYLHRLSDYKRCEVPVSTSQGKRSQQTLTAVAA